MDFKFQIIFLMLIFILLFFADKKYKVASTLIGFFGILIGIVLLGKDGKSYINKKEEHENILTSLKEKNNDKIKKINKKYDNISDTDLLNSIGKSSKKSIRK